MPLDQVTDSPTETVDAADLLRWMMTAGRAPRREAGIPLHQPVALEAPAGAYRGERFPASASLARKHGSEGPPPASEFFQTGRCLLPRLPIVGEKEADAPSQRRRASAESGWRRIWRRFIDLRRQRRVVEGQAGDAP